MWQFRLCIPNVKQKFMDVWRGPAMIYHLLKCLLKPTEGNGGYVFMWVLTMEIRDSQHNINTLNPPSCASRCEELKTMIPIFCWLGSSWTCTCSWATYGCVMDWTTCEGVPLCPMTYPSLLLLELINADDIFYFILHNVAGRWELRHTFQLSPLINVGGAIISWLLQLIIHNRPGSGRRQMATLALGGDKCGKSERAMTRNVWRGRQRKPSGKNLTVWHKEVSGNGAVVSPAIILSRLWQ